MAVKPVGCYPITLRGGVSVSPVQTERNRRGSGAAIIVSDTFTRANSSLALGTADTGQAWAAILGTWGISNNQGNLAVADPSFQMALIDSGVTNCTVTCTLVNASTLVSSTPGVFVRTADANNRINVGVKDANTLTIGHAVASTFAELTTGAWTWADGDVLKVVCSGNNITAFVNGSQVATTTEASNTATKHGLTAAGNAATSLLWDNFTVTVP